MNEQIFIEKYLQPLSKNFKDPKFRATEKIMKYKKPRYYG